AVDTDQCDLVLGVQRAHLFAGKGISRVPEILRRDDAFFDPAAQVSDQFERGDVLPANPPIAIDRESRNLNGLEGLEDVRAQRLEQLRSEILWPSFLHCPPCRS